MESVLKKVGKEALKGIKVAILVFSIGTIFGAFTKSDKRTK